MSNDAPKRPRKTKRVPLSDNVVVWTGIVIGLIAAFILDTEEDPRKWHAAIVWTMTAFSGALIWGRQKWRSWRFWLVWTVCLIVHVFVMWMLFAKILAAVRIGTRFVVLPAFAESLVPLIISLKIERKLQESHMQERKRVQLGLGNSRNT